MRSIPTPFAKVSQGSSSASRCCGWCIGCLDPGREDLS
jgi:hypothetical protein